MRAATLQYESDVASIAARLRRSAEHGVPIAPIRDLFSDATIEQAYSIQAANIAHWESEGREVVGAKIGLTAKSVQAQLGVDQPDFGHLFLDMAVQDGGTVHYGRLLQPKVEAEVAFVMAREPNPENLSRAELIESIAYATPAIEIVDSRIANWEIGIFDTVADNASSGLFVLGTDRAQLSAFQLELCGMVLEKNDEAVSFGAGAACLGNPLNSLAWLAAKMAEIGRPLREGDIVLSGALGPMVTVVPGDRARARINGLGEVAVSFGVRE